MRKNRIALIKEHGERLNNFFDTGIEPVELYKKLLRLERKAHHAADCLASTNNLHTINQTAGLKESSDDEIEMFFEKILSRVEKILGPKSKDTVFINLDPRGYAIKIKKIPDLNIYQDWGGNGILAPDFD